MSVAVVYRMYDDKATLLYVGCTAQLPVRLQQHAREKGWWSDVARVDVEHFTDLDNALVAERTAIASESPAHNIRHKNLTADEIAQRRERRRATKADRRRAFDEYLVNTKYWSPEDGEVIRCGNCGREPAMFPKGKPLSETPCKRCGVEAFERSAA